MNIFEIVLKVLGFEEIFIIDIEMIEEMMFIMESIMMFLCS